MGDFTELDKLGSSVEECVQSLHRMDEKNVAKFLDSGGWSILQTWLKHAYTLKKTSLLHSILNLLRKLPISSVSVMMKESNCSILSEVEKIIYEELRDKSEGTEDKMKLKTKQLCSELVSHWLHILHERKNKKKDDDTSKTSRSSRRLPPPPPPPSLSTPKKELEDKKEELSKNQEENQMEKVPRKVVDKKKEEILEGSLQTNMEKIFPKLITKDENQDPIKWKLHKVYVDKADIQKRKLPEEPSKILRSPRKKNDKKEDDHRSNSKRSSVKTPTKDCPIIDVPGFTKVINNVSDKWPEVKDNQSEPVQHIECCQVPHISVPKRRPSSSSSGINPAVNSNSKREKKQPPRSTKENEKSNSSTFPDLASLPSPRDHWKNSRGDSIDAMEASNAIFAGVARNVTTVASFLTTPNAFPLDFLLQIRAKPTPSPSPPLVTSSFFKPPPPPPPTPPPPSINFQGPSPHPETVLVLGSSSHNTLRQRRRSKRKSSEDIPPPPKPATDCVASPPVPSPGIPSLIQSTPLQPSPLNQYSYGVQQQVPMQPYQFWPYPYQFNQNMIIQYPTAYYPTPGYPQIPNPTYSKF